jgi:hypothetical protein
MVDVADIRIACCRNGRYRKVSCPPRGPFQIGLITLRVHGRAVLIFFAHVTVAHIIIPHDNGRLRDDCGDEKAVDAKMA